MLCEKWVRPSPFFLGKETLTTALRTHTKLLKGVEKVYIGRGFEIKAQNKTWAALPCSAEGLRLAVGAKDLRLLHRTGGAQAAAGRREEGVVLPAKISERSARSPFVEGKISPC